MISEKQGPGVEDEFDVVVVGAGAAGVGIGVALMHAGIENFLIIDRHDVGASFARWPKEMRFITPSFPTNSVGMLDINAVAIGTSPAYSLQEEHPSGRQYAAFLRSVATFFNLPVRVGTEVKGITSGPNRFVIETNEGNLAARFVIWAAGEFQYPQTQPFAGSEFCRHNSLIKSWQEVSGDDCVVIGGYESGIDAAVHLAQAGKNVTVLDRSDVAPWKRDESDPSTTLSTYTFQRLKKKEVAERILLVSGADVYEVQKEGTEYRALCTSGACFVTQTPPILATGFRGSVRLIAELFEPREEDGFPLLSAQDESTITPGLFLVGPMVRHDQHVFCFIYKFRQRFAVVAKAIADRLGLPAEQLETYRQWGMYLDDLSCCGEECVC
ncbi:NAD(P)/FAD-dependent oxidoreductase [Blastopirellula marina]|uniref:Monooxygenase n=1 Tax=Blastopirellula marina TaxID=124 RepID=A0A2S8G0P9_9BACT|nr:NAD(P)/FAD-dependent oxidoreductase [Blastopirellula marina]PQO38025.1 monooxygenase [Blastopirellula marina]PTL44681.1 monooxygenase [Blastopirellula marina]